MFTDDDAAKAAAVFFGHEMPGSSVAFRDALTVFAPLVAKIERDACIAALGDLANMAKIMGDVSATRALLSAADALNARDQ